MEVSSRPEALSAEQLRAADEGFAKLLRAKRMNPQFIAEHAEELMGQARREYAGWCGRGNVATNPPGWLILCAWQRTKDLLRAQQRRPQQLAFEEVLHLADEQTPTPEEAAIDHDRSERIFRALSRLPEKERKLVYLTYFNGLDVKAAGQMVGWKKSAAHRHHDAALARLQAMLGREFVITDVALAAWALKQGDLTTAAPGSLEAIVSAAHDVAASAWHRAAELGRKLSTLGDPVNASLTGAGAKVTGACAAAAIACLASGVVGPGIEGLKGDSAHHQTSHSAPVHHEAAARTAASARPAHVSTPAKRKPDHHRSQPPSRAVESEANAAVTAAEQETPTTSPTPASSQPQQTQTEFGIEREAASKPSGGAAPPVAEHIEAPAARPSGSAASQEFGM
jgi:RNA polymerase sigma factor (sigma-70 family)